MNKIKSINSGRVKAISQNIMDFDTRVFSANHLCGEPGAWGYRIHVEKLLCFVRKNPRIARMVRG